MADVSIYLPSNTEEDKGSSVNTSAGLRQGKKSLHLSVGLQHDFKDLGKETRGQRLKL